MVARCGSIVVATILGLFAADSLRADEPVGVATRSARTVRFARGRWIVGPTRTISTTTSSVSRTPAAVTAGATATTTLRPQDTQQPALAPAPQPFQPETKAPAASTQLSTSVFGSGTVPNSQLAQERRSRASAPGSDIVMGRESGFRATSDAGSLLGKSNQTRGVTSQKRTPIITDTRVRGAGVGSLVIGG